MNLDIPIYVFTCDSHLWLLNGFQYLFNKYWSPVQPVTIVGYGHPSTRGVKLRENFSFESINKHSYPAHKWSNGVIEFLEHRIGVDTFVMLLEDYWLTSPVPVNVVRILSDYIRKNSESNILRVDLTADRVSSRKARPIGSIEDIELVETPHDSDYQMSFQAAIWDKMQTLRVMKPFEDPWTSEVEGTRRLSKRPWIRVLGTANHPVKYKPVFRCKRGFLDISHLPNEDQEVIISNGWV